MMAKGSLQMQRYMSARRRGATMMTACAESTIAVSEARLIEADIARDPSLLAPLAADAPDPIPAPVEAPTQGDDDMARPKKAPQVEEVHAPDFQLAVRIYRGDIKPAHAKVGEHAQEMSTAYKEIKKRAYVQPAAARLAFRLDDMEEAKRDDFLRSFNGILRELNIFMPADMVDIANGTARAGEGVVPIGSRTRPQLATIPVGPEGDTDLAGDDEDQQAAE